MKVSEKSYQPGLLYDLSESLHDIIYSLTCSNPHFEILVSWDRIFPYSPKRLLTGKEVGLLILLSMMSWASYVEVSSAINSVEMETVVEEFSSIMSSRLNFLILRDT